MSAPALPRPAAPARPARPAPPARDYAVTGHDHWRTCGCGYHRQMREAANWDGPTPDERDL